MILGTNILYPGVIDPPKSIIETNIDIPSTINPTSAYLFLSEFNA